MDEEARTRMSDAQPDPFVGRTFDGYRIEAVIGRGGMGVVYRATQLSLNRPVALKVLPADFAERPQFRERFEREVDILSRLSHPNVVTVFERGEVDGQLYLVMEFIEGTSLREVIKQGPLPAHEALILVRSVLSALEHAHDRGIVHRDIKPENVLIAPGGIVKVADFGLSRLLGPQDLTRLTQTHLLLGTFEYMSPEQREKAKEADERSDLYATGVVLYEMIAGELPIGAFEPLSAKRPEDCDARLDEIVRKSLEKAPDRRFQRASEMGEAVSSLLTPVPVAQQAAPPPPPPAPVGRGRAYRFVLGLSAGIFMFIILAMVLGSRGGLAIMPLGLALAGAVATGLAVSMILRPGRPRRPAPSVPRAPDETPQKEEPEPPEPSRHHRRRRWHGRTKEEIAQSISAAFNPWASAGYIAGIWMLVVMAFVGTDISDRGWLLLSAGCAAVYFLSVYSLHKKHWYWIPAALVIGGFAGVAPVSPGFLGSTEHESEEKGSTYDARGWDALNRSPHAVIAKWTQNKEPGFVEELSVRPDVVEWITGVLEIDAAQARGYRLVCWREQIILVLPSPKDPLARKAAVAFSWLVQDAVSQVGGTAVPTRAYTDFSDPEFLKKVRETPLPAGLRRKAGD
ncbi:MAG: serine/threonine-protein kinase [Planctomycetota bacterium]